MKIKEIEDEIRNYNEKVIYAKKRLKELTEELVEELDRQVELKESHSKCDRCGVSEPHDELTSGLCECCYDDLN